MVMREIIIWLGSYLVFHAACCPACFTLLNYCSVCYICISSSQFHQPTCCWKWVGETDCIEYSHHMWWHWNPIKRQLVLIAIVIMTKWILNKRSEGKMKNRVRKIVLNPGSFCPVRESLPGMRSAGQFENMWPVFESFKMLWTDGIQL